MRCETGNVEGVFQRRGYECFVLMSRATEKRLGVVGAVSIDRKLLAELRRRVIGDL